MLADDLFPYPYTVRDLTCRLSARIAQYISCVVDKRYAFVQDNCIRRESGCPLSLNSSPGQNSFQEEMDHRSATIHIVEELPVEHLFSVAIVASQETLKIVASTSHISFKLLTLQEDPSKAASSFSTLSCS